MFTRSMIGKYIGAALIFFALMAAIGRALSPVDSWATVLTTAATLTAVVFGLVAALTFVTKRRAAHRP